jgi:hypothetical protein
MDVLKWIGIALAAGFVGYFGRYLAMLIIARIHKRKSNLDTTPEPNSEVSTSQSASFEELKLKLEKKKAKVEAKKAKKDQKY